MNPSHGRQGTAGAHRGQANGGHRSGDRLLVMDELAQCLLKVRDSMQNDGWMIYYGSTNFFEQISRIIIHS